MRAEQKQAEHLGAPGAGAIAPRGRPSAVFDRAPWRQGSPGSRRSGPSLPPKRPAIEISESACGNARAARESASSNVRAGAYRQAQEYLRASPGILSQQTVSGPQPGHRSLAEVIPGLSPARVIPGLADPALTTGHLKDADSPSSRGRFHTRSCSGFSMAGSARPSPGELFERRNPADLRDLVSLAPQSSVEDLRAACGAAREAARAWAQTPAPQRAEVLGRLCFCSRKTRSHSRDSSLAKSASRCAKRAAAFQRRSTPPYSFQSEGAAPVWLEAVPCRTRRQGAVHVPPSARRGRRDHGRQSSDRRAFLKIIPALLCGNAVVRPLRRRAGHGRAVFPGLATRRAAEGCSASCMAGARTPRANF